MPIPSGTVATIPCPACGRRLEGDFGEPAIEVDADSLVPLADDEDLDLDDEDGIILMDDDEAGATPSGLRETLPHEPVSFEPPASPSEPPDLAPLPAVSPWEAEDPAELETYNELPDSYDSSEMQLAPALAGLPAFAEPQQEAIPRPRHQLRDRRMSLVSLADHLGLAALNDRFQLRKWEPGDALYRVQVTHEHAVSMTVLDIRDGLLRRDISRETWIRQISDDAGAALAELNALSDDEGRWAVMHASDDEIARYLAMEQMIHSAASGYSTVSPGDVDMPQRPKWTRIGDSLAREDFDIQVLYRPVWAHFKAGGRLGGAIGLMLLLLLLLLSLVGGGVAATVEGGMAGLLGYLGVLAVLAVSFLICCLVYLPDYPGKLLLMWAIGLWPLLAIMALLAVLIIPFLAAVALGAAIGAPLGLMVGIARWPFLPRGPRSIPGAVPMPRAPISEIEHARRRTPWLRVAVVGCLGIVLVGGLLSFGIPLAMWHGGEDAVRDRAASSVAAALRPLTAEHVLSAEEIAALEIRDRLLFAIAARNRRITNHDLGYDNRNARDILAERAIAADRLNAEGKYANTPLTVFLMRGIDRHDDVYYPATDRLEARNVDLEAAVFLWPEREFVGRLRITVPYMDRGTTEFEPAAGEFERYDKLFFEARPGDRFVDHLLPLVLSIKHSGAAPAEMIVRPAEEGESPPPPDEGESPLPAEADGGGELAALPEAEETGGNDPEMALEPVREWVDVSGGFRVEARFVRLEGDNVVLDSESRGRLTVPLRRFSQADREYVASRLEHGDQPQAAPAGCGL